MSKDEIFREKQSQIPDSELADLEHYWSFVFDRDTNFKTIRFNKYKTLEDLTPLNLELTGNHLK